MKHGLEYLKKDSSIEIQHKLRKIIKGLVIDTAVKIPEGRRHTALISIADSLLFNHLGKGKKESEKRLKDFFEEINRQLCEPMPLPKSELNNIWESALGFVQGIGEQKQEEGDDEETQDRRSQAQIMLELALENISVLFKDQYGVPHAEIQIDTHHEIMKVDSSKFRRYLSKLFYEGKEQVACLDAVSGVINVLQAKAEYKGETIPLFLRTAWCEGDIYYDMTDNIWQSIKITKEGTWEKVAKTPCPLFAIQSNCSSRA
jgi:hypothetical protein